MLAASSAVSRTVVHDAADECARFMKSRAAGRFPRRRVRTRAAAPICAQRSAHQAVESNANLADQPGVQASKPVAGARLLFWPTTILEVGVRRIVPGFGFGESGCRSDAKHLMPANPKRVMVYHHLPLTRKVAMSARSPRAMRRSRRSIAHGLSNIRAGDTACFANSW